MSKQTYMDVRFNNGHSEEMIRVFKITNEFELSDMKNTIVRFAGGTKLDDIEELLTHKGVKIGLSALYTAKDVDQPIYVKLIKVSGD